MHGGFGVVSVLNIQAVIRDPVRTSITLTRENELIFPAVTICSLSLLNTTILQSAGPDVIVGLFDDIRVRSDIEQCNVRANQLVANTGANVSWGELINLTLNDLSVLLYRCTYSGEQCTMDDFEPISTVAGLCYTFNRPQASRPSRVARGTGVRQGLQLQLSQDHQLFSLNMDRGFRVVIHNPDELPRPESDGIAVGLDSAVYIGMRQVNSIDRTVFSSGLDCRANTSQGQDLSFPGYPAYSQSACQAECLYKHLITSCGCIEPNLFVPVSDRYSGLRSCAGTDLCCSLRAFDEVEESCDCPPRCNTVGRTHIVSYSSTLFVGFVSVSVFYESLILETRETTDSYTPWSLVSDIGGNTGLFLGFTLLSIVELLLLVIGLMKDCCCSYKS